MIVVMVVGVVSVLCFVAASQSGRLLGVRRILPHESEARSCCSDSSNKKKKLFHFHPRCRKFDTNRRLHFDNNVVTSWLEFSVFYSAAALCVIPQHPN